MRFMLDENVPRSMADMLADKGFEVEYIRDFAPLGAPDPIVATVAEREGAILVSFDGDFHKIAPKFPTGTRARFKRLSRIWMRCDEVDGAARLKSALDLLDFEVTRARLEEDPRVIIHILRKQLSVQR